MITQTERFTIKFGKGRKARAIRFPRKGEAADALAALGLKPPMPAIYIAGGAGGMTAEEMYATRALIDEGLAPAAEKYQIAIICGGTQAGVPQLIGQSRREHGYRFPLIGVAPYAMVNYPGHENPDGYPLEEGHSHFVLTTGDEFGDESHMITCLTNTLSGKGEKPALGLLINGGEIARAEIHARTTSQDVSFPLLVLEGTGRMADELAEAIRTGKTQDKLLKAVMKKGEVEVFPLDIGPQGLRKKLAAYFKEN